MATENGSGLRSQQEGALEAITSSTDVPARRKQQSQENGGVAGHSEVARTGSSVEPRSRKRYAVSTHWEREYEEIQAERVGESTTIYRQCCAHRCTGTVEDTYSCFCGCARRRVGNMFFLAEREDGSPRLVVGPCWPFCACVTVPLILFVSGVVTYFIVLDVGGRFGLPWWLALIYFPVLIVTLASLFFVSCRDPGLLERVTDEEAGRDGWFWNEQTGSFRPTGAMYCRECKVLIQDYDHLCPWTGTGIGRGNMCAFKVFVGSVNILCYLSIALVAACLIGDVV